MIMCVSGYSRSLGSSKRKQVLISVLAFICLQISMILVPVKNFENAKQRLASVLDQGTRTELAQAMLHDVLDALAACCSNSEVSLVTSDPFVLNLAQTFSFQIIRDATNRSDTDAIQLATQPCE